MSFGSWSMHSFWALSSIWKTDIPRQEMYRFYQCFTKPPLHKRRHQRKQFVKSVQQKQTHKCTQRSAGSCNPSPRLHDWGSEVPVCRSPLQSLSACKWQPQLTYCQHKNSTNRYSAVKYTQSWDSSAHNYKNKLQLQIVSTKAPKELLLVPVTFSSFTGAMGQLSNLKPLETSNNSMVWFLVFFGGGIHFLVLCSLSLCLLIS